MDKKKVLILGATGMIGNGLFKVLSSYVNLDVYGTRRGESDNPRIRRCVDADSFDTVIRAFAAIKPEIIINCIGIIKQNPEVEDYLTAITVNSQLPHRLSMLARASNAKLIQISTDCVFDGKKGNYVEQDNSNAEDIYGKSKALGEVIYPPHCITLRTSLIGHELKNYKGLLEWFLTQKDEIRGYTKAMFSGLTVHELGKVIAEYVIPHENMNGLYHISSNPISKYELLNIIKDIYGKSVVINKYDGIVVNRDLNSNKFRNEFGYYPPDWRELIAQMHDAYLKDEQYRRCD